MLVSGSVSGKCISALLAINPGALPKVGVINLRRGIGTMEKETENHHIMIGYM